MFYLYIIFSTSINKHYIGITHDLEERLNRHNSKTYKKAFTKAANDWEYRLTLKCKNKEHATQLERFIKKMKSRKFIQKIIDNPSILEDIYKNL